MKKDGWIINTFIRNMLATCMVAGVSLTALSACGFHLRGYDVPMTYDISSVVLSMQNDPISFNLKRPLKQRLQGVGVQVVDNLGQKINSSNDEYTAVITVDNIRFKRYELVGVLTEISLVLSADVTYQTLLNEVGSTNQPVTVTNPIQVERSYQFNEASVSAEDKQGELVKDWLYDSLAQRITDQYVALILPRVPPSALSNDSTK